MLLGLRAVEHMIRARLLQYAQRTTSVCELLNGALRKYHSVRIVALTRIAVTISRT